MEADYIQIEFLFKKIIILMNNKCEYPKVGVLIISYGATRTFRVFDERNNIKEIPLIHGHVLHMSENFQTEFEHDLK